MDLHALNLAAAALTKDSPLGLLAAALREHFCSGTSAVMLRVDMMDRIYQAFACLEDDGSAAGLARPGSAGTFM